MDEKEEQIIVKSENQISKTGNIYIIWNEMYNYYGECYKIGCTNNI